MKMKTILFALSLLLALGVSFILFQDNWVARSAEKENYCFTCHTNARKLIQITREIAKAKKGKPSASVESEGEG
ncbi:MAG: hypothetical protein IMF11_04625 [Proteobacteria bacterium]|jgi:nitrate/TMAO reductase-like tetraheme cytochrome c subunit|nr:hypothetical protein [Pseudomonadota bacterium]